MLVVSPIFFLCLVSGCVGNTGIVYITHKLFQDISQLMSSLSQADEKITVKWVVTTEQKKGETEVYDE